MTDARRTDLTMADIARMAGVSESTVSRALAGSPLVAEKTRQRIADLASAAAYSVNEGARNLRLRQTRTIEVVIPIEADNREHISDPFYLDLLGAIADSLTWRGYDLLLSTTPPWSRDGRASSILAGRADGIIIIGQGRRRTELRDLARTHRAVVVWGANVEDDYAIVGCDNLLGGRLAAAHLLSLGRRRIAFFGDAALPEISLRWRGYCEALIAAGLTPNPDLVAPTPFDMPAAFQSVRHFLNRGVKFDAVVCASDVIAMSAINALREAGLVVPDDVAVTGFDDIFSAAWFSPPLTTVSQSIQSGGEALVRLLLDRIDGSDASSIVIEPQLVIRQSSGAPIT